MTGWLEHAAAFAVLWLALALLLAPFIGERLKRNTPTRPAPGDHHPSPGVEVPAPGPDQEAGDA
jgi:hypothetical protein